MKIKSLASLALVMAAAACSGNSLGGGTDGGGTAPPPPAASGVPETLSLNLKGASFNPGDPTITVAFSAQDAAALNAVYNRNPAYDRAGYVAYSYQETTSNRYVVALVKQSGSAKAAMVVDSGQFINYHAGGTYARADVFSMPATGLGTPFNYSGSYVGLMNIGTPAPGGPGGGLNPEQPYQTEGRALITADFTEMSLSGGVDGRRIVNPAPGDDPNLDDINLYETNIAADGSFFGDVFIGTQDVGDYGGIFAGIEARDVATLLVFNPYKTAQPTEHGLIVLTNCAVAGGPACP